MYKLEPNDIQGMLSEAARVLTKPKDREVMRRLVAFTKASSSAEWDRKLIAAMLAKAGKMHEAELVINDIESRWQRSDAWCSAARAVLEINDKVQGLELLHVAAMEAGRAQEEGSDQDAQSASAVLADVSELYAHQEDFGQAEGLALKILHPIRRERALEKIRELRGDTYEEELAADAATSSESDEAESQ